MGDERRGSPRIKFRTLAVCQKGAHGMGEAVCAHLLDISKSGSRVLARGEFEAHEDCLFLLLSPQREAIVELKATVRWARREPYGIHRLGMAFERELTDREMGFIE